MKPELYASTYERLKREPAWSLLTAHLAPEFLALLQHLLYSNERVLPASVLEQRLETELAELRLNGRDLPGSAGHYVTFWLRERWIERSLREGAEEEELELTTAALQALRLVSALSTVRSTATESRLSIVMDQLARLAEQTDPDPQSRLRRLMQERERIDAEIDAVSNGKVDVLTDERALEQLQEIIALASELADDFRRVRDDFSKLNREFRERIIHDEGNRGDLLSDLFSNVDVIAQSGPGQSFDAFWRLLTDAEQSARLEVGVEDVFSRGFSKRLGRKERTFLRRLTGTLLDRAGGVNNARTGFAKSLRGFVQSREYREQRRLSRLLRDAKSSALEAAEVFRPTDKVGHDLSLSSATYRSIGRLRPHDPVQRMDDTAVTQGESADVSLHDIAQAVVHSEIDFRTLRANVLSMLAEVSQCSIGDVLAAFEATQGLGTVVGYLALGVKHGQVITDQHERVSWRLDSGELRWAGIPLVYFMVERIDELAA
ncbi:hypothetical protein A7A76_16735 [Lysobacter enzymogenes]|uniref:DUF3375 domain-containing protein n=1 Tax=Lysobacter enzymogenes TaxID=69 RepID=UPI0019D233B4|nr:DUF3375 domain-containing protein [Lysobacter enzymogenes]MBN7136384.1 hypothetical protein [Lysobacter enzymogenes]